ncbi:hypothetical protein GCM10027449_03920 [Sinomonas notoginsengisoli]|uniref:hypothetical protein n=1 Tax=Sinomonas notoginsengisoli TaxID=1457311 RepID=UPI001F237069|nr:hypothetical protein [Sinomonas notoginsengisoli]
MSTAAVHSNIFTAGPERARLTLVEDTCRDCGRALAEFEEHLCAACIDLEAHAWCRECGAVLANADLEVGACAACLA